jgi:hypothetical protein
VCSLNHEAIRPLLTLRAENSRCVVASFNPVRRPRGRHTVHDIDKRGAAFRHPALTCCLYHRWTISVNNERQNMAYRAAVPEVVRRFVGMAASRRQPQISIAISATSQERPSAFARSAISGALKRRTSTSATMRGRAGDASSFSDWAGIMWRDSFQAVPGRHAFRRYQDANQRCTPIVALTLSSQSLKGNTLRHLL